ncbi:MAG: S-adenosyl-l-methionine hydroxide adenosyltransferase family protein, partial [Longimicrobiales bacterium]
VRLDDAAHDLEQGDIRGGSWALSRYWNRYPPGTVHLVVIDPGVGTGRRALAVEVDGRRVVVPDNGLLTRVLDSAEEWTAVETTNETFWGRDRSRTFHGRDLFAPVAGHLARGVALDALGPGVTDPVRLEEPEPRRTSDGIVGEVVIVDRFGNLITNISASDLRSVSEGTAVSEPIVIVGGSEREGTDGNEGGTGDPTRLSLAESYGSVEPGGLTALINSADRLEVAVRNGSAARRLAGARGLTVEVRRTP